MEGQLLKWTVKERKFQKTLLKRHLGRCTCPDCSFGLIYESKRISVRENGQRRAVYRKAAVCLNCDWGVALN